LIGADCLLVSQFQGALRNAIATFVPVSPVMKNNVWSFLEQYDLPVVATPLLNDGAVSTQVRSLLFYCFSLGDVYETSN
jgi:hypothetical protein